GPKPAQFHLVTMWEVLEHISTPDLPQLFRNITYHLARGGYFVASTTSCPDVHNGVDLHQTKWSNAEWKAWLGKNFPELEWVDLGLKYYQFVRHNDEGSFLTYRKV
ncbi:MAG TPA: class I SAM-dependent methyltransferase, partial [Verrucomicrobiae bacterium]